LDVAITKHIGACIQAYIIQRVGLIGDMGYGCGYDGSILIFVSKEFDSGKGAGLWLTNATKKSASQTENIISARAAP
jgi:hypothetical protein